MQAQLFKTLLKNKFSDLVIFEFTAIKMAEFVLIVFAITGMKSEAHEIEIAGA
jgi:hypothetical protein